jgi:multidrug efflux pump subunit AcrA (membrane-fusion protein)
MLQTLPATLRASARIEVNERGQHVIAPRFEGWVERLQVNTTGQAVAAGQPLFEVYSPDLATAQQEYTLVAGNPNLKGLADAALTRLRNWGIAESEIKALAAGGTVRARPTVTFRAPVSGVVVEKKAVAGMRFMAGEALFQIADLSRVWVVADVPEQDAARLRLGQAAKVQVDALPGSTLQGRVDFIAPLLKNETRTLSVRVELPNPGQRLRPGMYANLLLESGGSEKLLTVPNSAVLDSGRRQMVLVERGEGRFEPREVSLGQRGDERVAVLSGLKEGERVVVAANFLIDAESNLKAALGGFGNPGEQAAKPAGVGHHASGKIDEIDAKAGSITISHGPVASLKWPAMTMEFQPANPSLLQGLKPGAAIDFEFVERGKGEWVITKVEASGNAASANSGH